MRDEPPDAVTDDERTELDVLRRRAYGPDADIVDDAAALARLQELEDRMRPARAQWTDTPSDSSRADAAAQPVPATAPVTVPTAAATARTPPWHGRLVAGTAVAAVLLGAAAWSQSQVPPPKAVASGYAKTAAVASEQRAAGYEAGYRMYLDGLREEVLSMPGTDAVAERLIRDQFNPYGILYGRTVGAGPTTNNEFCMIVADRPTSSITCIPADTADATPISVLLPAWYSDAESDVFTGLGELVSYTLLPGGGVLAEPAE